MKQGGESFKGSRKGVTNKFRCSICNRLYKMEWARNGHERGCKEYNKK